MYGFQWDSSTHGYTLTTTTGKFVANELRPVFAEELLFYGFQDRLLFNPNEPTPLLWAQKNNFFYNGEKIITLDTIEYGKPIAAQFFFNGTKKLAPVHLLRWVKKSKEILDALIFDTLKRIKEIYDQNDKGCGIKYIAFSGGKDSMLLLDLCHRVLPLTVPVVFSDTDMELPSTYDVWKQVQNDPRYAGRPFMKVTAERSALENWELFGPPSRVLRWCCSVHKSTPAILALKEYFGNFHAKLLAFVGVRADESLRRAEYDDIGEGGKNSSQTQAMPILGWSAHELWLYTFREQLVINDAYRKGIPRVGCIMCPLTTKRQADLIRQIYPEHIQPFVLAIEQQSSRPFKNKADVENFVYDGGRHARNNGTYLKNVIDIPTIDRNENLVIFSLTAKNIAVFLEWIKILGRVEMVEGERRRLYYRNEQIEFDIKTNEQIYRVIFLLQKSNNIKQLISHLSKIYHKAQSCVDCRACESECLNRAIQFRPLSIDSSKCIHCQRCNEKDNGCLAYHSRRNTKGTISGQALYYLGLLKRRTAEIKYIKSIY